MRAGACAQVLPGYIDGYFYPGIIWALWTLRAVRPLGLRRIAIRATLRRCAVGVEPVATSGAGASMFDDETNQLCRCELDLRGSAKDVLDRIGASLPKATRGPGTAGRTWSRPREVRLLPRHWDWLNAQPGGASVALRKLVENARRVNEVRDRVQRAREVTYRFISALAGDLPGFEEATRALFAETRSRFERGSQVGLPTSPRIASSWHKTPSSRPWLSVARLVTCKRVGSAGDGVRSGAR